ncbi:hypothetical protein ASPNIDRAFT_43477 [Aspergillus niger ATCC 1015]|uniref:Uncharacterized protein n=2 Tax=Aspergillus niger TaxID=5061 RepID=G3XM98_ASPNA|nr:hypothetical protein ASPNIDRAFT_43477 [Aspergillus niger ATCC 1015]KAI2986670.1 hypothetical protein CBS147345_10916 [Aspergillus niger]TPR06633.1 RTA1 like family protein [Aspergillus niger]SPB43058.1 unnamed protein product [Aspergillus niger]
MAQQGQPQTVAPVEPCWNYPIYQAYLVLIDPAAQPYRNVVDHFWFNLLHVRETLRSHMLRDQTMRTTMQTTYGIVTVGDRVRFYYMSRNDLEGELCIWNGNPVNAPEADESPILNVHDPIDQERIHQLMLRMRQDILSGNNTY